MLYIYKAFFLFHSSDSSSSSSDDSPARSVQSAAVPAPSALPLSSLDKDEPRKSFGIKVQNLPVRSTGQLLRVRLCCIRDAALHSPKFELFETVHFFCHTH